MQNPLSRQLFFKNNTRKNIVFRYGGDESLVIVNADSLADTGNNFNRFRTNIEAAPFEHKLTVSIGLVKLTSCLFD